MRAVVTTEEQGKVVMEDVPDLQVLPGKLLVQVKKVAICGTDLEYLKQFQAKAILGHEFSGEVIEVGEGLEGWSVGDRVSYSGVFQRPCGRCYYCKRRLHHLCSGSPGMQPEVILRDTPKGYVSAFGGFAEYLVRPPTFFQEVPEGVSHDEAALCEPISVGLDAVNIAGLEPGDTSVIIGAGKIGLGALLCAKAAGASAIVVTRKTQSRLDKAMELGADAVINASQSDMIEEVARLCETGVGPDAVLICARQGKVLNESLRMVRRGGIVVLAGGVPPTEINPGVILGKNLRLVGMVGNTPTAAVMQLMARKQIDAKGMITEVAPLEEAQRALDGVNSGENLVPLLEP